MTQAPELGYDQNKQIIYIEHSGERTQLYSNATQDEFAIISDIDELATKTTALSEALIDTIQRREDLIQKQDYFELLNMFQQRAAANYEECQRLQTTARERDSEVVTAHLSLLYKLDKYLQHYFRQLSIAQSLGFSQRLLFTYLSDHDYVFLYGFVRNVCSTLEYLGKLVESREGEGTLGLADKGVNFTQVYRELQQEGLDGTFTDGQPVLVPPTNTQMQMGDVALSNSEMEFLWEKRNEIVHHCPLVVGKETVEHLPEDLLTTAVLTQSDLKRLTALASRVHLHSIGIFLKFSASYLENLVDQLVGAWYADTAE